MVILVLEAGTGGTVGPAAVASVADAVVLLRLLRDAGGTPIDAIIEFANDPWREGLGLAGVDVVGRTLLEVAPAMGDRIPILARAIDTAEAIELVGPSPEGSARRFLVQVTPQGQRASVVVHEVTRELELEAAVLAGHRRMTVALDAIPEAYVLYRPVLDEAGAFVDAEILHANRFARDRWFSGATLGDVRGRHLFTVYPEYRDNTFDLYQEVVQTGRAWRGVRRMESPTGDLWLDLLVAPTSDGFLHTSRDITETEQARLALEESERRYRTLADNIADIVVTGAPGAGTWYSPSVERVLGWSPAQAAAMPPFQLIHPLDVPAVAAALARVDTGEAIGFEARYRCADGSWRWLSARARPVLAATGAVTGRVGILRDAHAEHEAREALAASEARYRSVVASLSEGLVIRGRDGAVEEINDRARELIGIPATASLAEVRAIEAVVIAGLQDLDGAAVPRSEAPGLAAARSGSTVPARDVVTVGPDGRRLWNRVSARPLRDAAGEVAGSVVTFSDITAEREAHATAERQQHLIDLAHDAILVRHMDGTILSWNKGAAALYGWDADEAIGRVSHELLTTSFPESLDLILSDVAGTGAWEGRLRHVTRDGRAVTVDSRWVAIRERDGRIDAVMEINRDVTEALAAAEALARRDAELEEAQRLGASGSWRLDSRTGEAQWSSGMFRIFGVDPATGMPDRDRLADLVGRDVAARRLALAEQVLATGEGSTSEFDITRADGSTVHVQAHAELVRDGDGEVLGMRGAVVDITDLHRARQAAERAATELAEAQELAHVGSWSWDPTTDAFAWSDELFRIAGLLPGGPAPTRAEQAAIYDATELDRFISALAARLPDDPPYETELEVWRPDGSRRRVLTRAEPEWDADGRVVMVRGTVADVTDLQAAQVLLERFNEELEAQVAERTARLEIANEELRTFSHAISHDLRGPARAVASFAGLVLRSAGETLDETDRHRLDNIVQSGVTMGRLLDDLATYTRLGQRSVVAVPVPLGPLVADLRVRLAARLDRSGGELRLIGDDVIPLADPGLLGRILFNLTDNGLTYARPGVAPVVEIALARRGDKVAVSVRDNGIGIPVALQERVFDLFTRTRPGQQLEESGVGLAVARRAARAMGADLALDSTVGVGSTFSLELPEA